MHVVIKKVKYWLHKRQETTGQLETSLFVFKVTSNSTPKVSVTKCYDSRNKPSSVIRRSTLQDQVWNFDLLLPLKTFIFEVHDCHRTTSTYSSKVLFSQKLSRRLLVMSGCFVFKLSTCDKVSRDEYYLIINNLNVMSCAK